MSVFAIAERIARCLEEDRLDYAIGGALALSVWALPRDTADVDLSIFAAAAQLPAVTDSLERAGLMIWSICLLRGRWTSSTSAGG